MENNILPQWMLKALGMLLIVFITIVILNQLRNFYAPPEIMRVTAEGKVIAIPDVATVRIGVTSEGTDPVAVKNQINQKMNQIIVFVKQQNISDRDIQTTEFYASPKYNYNNGQNTLIGYQSTQTVTVKVSGIDKSKATLEKILGDVIDRGANNIQGINFQFSDTEKLREIARKEAINNAISKAKQLSSDANLTLGKITNVIEPTNDSINPMPRALMSLNVAQSKSIEPNIEPGSQEVIENIGLLFEVYKK